LTWEGSTCDEYQVNQTAKVKSRRWGGRNEVGMNKRKYHFGAVDLIYPAVMNTICGALSPSSQIEKHEKPALRDRCKRCVTGIKRTFTAKAIREGKVMEGNGFWFRRRDDI